MLPFARLPPALCHPLDRPPPLPYARGTCIMNNSLRLKLFLMMVLEFFIWGAWLPLIFGYLPQPGLLCRGTI